jgi:hypothetical protein
MKNEEPTKHEEAPPTKVWIAGFLVTAVLIAAGVAAYVYFHTAK